MEVAKEPLGIRHVEGPTGVRGRKSDHQLILAKLKWKPRLPLVDGIRATYQWIEAQVSASRSRELPTRLLPGPPEV